MIWKSRMTNSMKMLWKITLYNIRPKTRSSKRAMTTTTLIYRTLLTRTIVTATILTTIIVITTI